MIYRKNHHPVSQSYVEKVFLDPRYNLSAHLTVRRMPEPGIDQFALVSVRANIYDS